MRLHFDGATTGLLEAPRAQPGVTEVRSAGEGNGVELYADRGGLLIPQIVALASERKAEILDVHIAPPLPTS